MGVDRSAGVVGGGWYYPRSTRKGLKVNLELSQEQQLLTRGDVKKILKRLGDADSIELLDYMARNMWELYEVGLGRVAV